MRRGTGKRILSLALALELLCTPLAMARAEDPARLREETPLGEEARPAQTPTEDLPVADVPVADTPVTEAPAQSGGETARTPSSTASASASIFALPGMDSTNSVMVAAPDLDPGLVIYHLGLSYGRPTARFGGYLKQESDAATWGYSGGPSGRWERTISLGDDGYLYFFLPDMGRVPDLELEGLYLYAGAKNLYPGDSYASWVDDPTALGGFDEAHPENYRRLDWEAVPQAYVNDTVDNLSLSDPTSETDTLVRFPASQVDESFAYRVSPDEDVAYDRWSIPIVARWTPSGHSDMALFALDITDSAAGETTPVTDLYTKPFRQAAAADHIKADESYSVTYQTQTAEDLAGNTSSSVTRTGTVFTPNPSDEAGQTQHYYLRVEEEQDSITLRFLTQEPNYEYHITQNGGGPSPVTVTATFADKGGTVALPFALSADWDGDGQPFFPQSLLYGVTRVAQNRTALPARGQWTAADIPLKKVSDAADAEADPFNTITVTIQSPDATAQSVYVFHIERLMTPETTLGNGNSPVGMIARDNSSLWSTSKADWNGFAADLDPTEDLAAYNKASAVNYFKSNYTFRDMPILPTGTRNQSGAIYKGSYSTLAWYGVSSNPDFDPATVAAYQDMAFDDPGVSFVDSEGHKVVFGQGVSSEYETCVTRTLELRTAPALGVDSYGAEGVQCWYSMDANGKPCLTTDETKAAQTLRRADGSDPVDLRGLIVLPGVYEAVYTFTDPVSGDVLTTKRTVVVLPIPGDVDMDGAVTAADAVQLDANATAWNADGGKVYRLLRNRVYGMDLGDNSGKLTADTIRKGFQPVLGATEALGYSDYPYLPLPYTGDNDYHVRKTWSEVTPLNGASGAKLRLDFLGIEQGTWHKAANETYTTGISGPWASPKVNGDNPGVSIVSGSPSSGTGDVFWMGVYVEDPGTMKGSIKDLSISLIYDSEYVRPAMVHSVGEGLAYGDDATRWQLTTLLKYNFLAGSRDAGGLPQTIFSGRTGSDYTYTNSVLDRAYATHYSKVEGDLELAYTDTYGQLNSGKLKEVVFSLQGKSGGTLATMEKGYLLVLPFQLIRHPDERMDSAGKAQLIELSAGMRDFSVVLEGGAQVQAQGIFALFSAQPKTSAGSTYAFSAQDKIYGEITQNIRQTLTYDHKGDLVPIGEDKTQRTDLRDGLQDPVYDEPFEIVSIPFYGGDITAGELPPGLELDRWGAKITGTPTKVGVYDFSIDNEPYRITVTPKTIHYRAVPATSYYGESEFRGESKDRVPGQRDFTFIYDRDNLSSRDQAAAQTLFSNWAPEGQGTGDELEKILARTAEIEAGVTYIEPRFYAQDSSLRAISYKANVGKYDIVTENVPKATNYELVYDREETGQLTVMARPVWISYLDIPQDRSGSRIYNDQAGINLTLTAEEKAGEELIVLGFDDSLTGPQGNREFKGMPLTGDPRVAGDRFTLRYGANYVPNQVDLDYVASQGSQVAYRFLLEENEEARPLSVIQVADSFIGANASNYTLQGGRFLESEKCNIVGTVVRRGVEAISFSRYPAILQYNDDGTPRVQSYYGDRVNDEALFVVVTRGAGDGATNVGEYAYNNPLLRPMELHYNWVSPEDMAEGLKPENLETLVGTNWDPDLPEGEQDLHPYNGTDPLTPDMDGYYLCAAVKKYEAGLESGEESHYIKVYSDHPVRVAQRTITLTVQPMTRYYGEPNGDLRYTYNHTDMIPEDDNALRDWVAQKAGDPSATPTLDGAELEEFFREVMQDKDFTPPTLEVSKNHAIPVLPEDRVDQTTPVGGGEFYIILQGGKSTNYNFAYVRPTVVDNIVSGNQTETVRGEGAFGFSKMTMMKRPIVISDIYSPGGDKENFETIYADTKNLFLQNQTAGLDRVSFTLPRNDSAATYFYRYGGSATEIKLAQTYADPDGSAVANNDDVTVRYSVRFMCDPSHYRWLGFDNNYYDVTTLSDAGGTMQKDVVVADMELLGDAAVNYELVYNTSEQAMQRAPSNVQPKTYPNPNHNGDNTRYLIHGTGQVTLRKISTLEVQRLSPAAGMESVGQVHYTYGDNYAPYVNNPVSGTPLTLVLNYETEEDERHNNGDHEANVHSETLTFQTKSGTTNFAQRGLVIYYLKPGQSTDQAIQAGQVLDHTTPMVPDEHNGARLFVTGKRRAEDPTVTSKLSDSTLQVDKKSLTFTTRNAHRFYGERLHVNDGDVIDDDYIGTTAFTYSFPTAQLALRDREELARLKGVAVANLPAVSTEADLKLLSDSGWSVGLQTPIYTADPGVDAPVNKDRWGEYAIGITPKNLKNYEVTGVPGTLYVYPRPVRVENVQTSAEEPVYTIYNQSNSNLFVTQLDTEKVELSRTNLNYVASTGQVVDTRVSTRYCSDNILRSMPLSGNALVGADAMTFTVQLWFYSEGNSTWNLDAGIADYAKPQVRITFREVKASEVSKNYAVNNVSLVERETFQRDGFWGAVKLRTIDEIFITGKPKTEYTYGDVLDLSGLQVTIRYKAIQGAGEVNVVNYLGPDSFKAVGLYVNYWYPEDLVPGGRKPNATEDGEKGPGTTTEQEDDQRKALPYAHRRADSGDHLTIAPTHDTQQYVGQTSSDPLKRAFAANGKYLIVSAFQEGEKQTAATPKVLGAMADNTSVGTTYERENAPIPIIVKPLQLRYDLSAADKTYDGTTQAAGTLTLVNVFDATVQVKIEESNGGISGNSERVRDVVYIPMGAAYENHGDDHAAAGYNAYRNALRNGVVAFTTGVYRPGGEAPLMENGQLDWADGYEWGKGLTFTFANPNVHYLEAGETQPRAIGTQAMADYWHASQAANDVKDQWDAYGEICAMPVEVTGMALAGPDAVNYTWATDGTAQRETTVTMTTRSQEVANQASAPYATIYKANRATIQSMAGQNMTLPYLQLDEHTNVARLFYGQDLAAMADSNNIDSSSDEFRDELHFEYALYYEGEDGLMTQWAGAKGNRAYQDTTFFGGEFIQPAIDSAYVPDYGHMTALEDAPEDFIRKGQRYRWADEDTGLSALGYREDAGVARDLDAYPGGAENAELYYAWYYDLYTWGAEGLERESLPRDTVFYPLVRLSETHNYNPSGNLTGDADVTAQALDTAQKAVAKLAGAEEDETLTTDALAASADVFSAAQSMKEAALALSAQRVADDAALAEANKLPEEGRPLMGSAPAVKTFLQRLDILSAGWERNNAEGDSEEYLVQILEDVWFTDTLVYPDTKNMDAVVFNSPTRYYGYYWDVDKSAQIHFGEEELPIDFDTVMTVEIRQRQSDGSTADMLYTYDPDATNHTAQIYVQTTRSGSRPVRTIRIVPQVVYARLGDEPYQLSVVTTPTIPSERRYTWTTSDPSVVTVNQYGVLTFRGEGSAIITITTSNGRVATATVTVSPVLPVTQISGSLFNFNYPGPWALLDGDYAFRPKLGMTRGELVTLLDIFLAPSDQWQATQELAYIDVTGREKYYDALKRLTGAGVVTGIPGSAFAGDQLATRAEFVTMLSRMLKLDIVDTAGMTHAFADVDENSTWAYAYIDALAKSGVIRGVGGGDFAPDRVITREETAAIIARLLTTKLDLARTDLLRPSDMTPENWSYSAVLRSVNTVLFPD